MKFCQDRGDLCFVDREYINSDAKHNWQCKKCGHTWTATAKSIRHGSKCPNCAGRCYQLSDIKKIASSRNFQLLSTKFIGIKGKYTWKCPDGHTWATTASHIKGGTGCPYCKSYITEEACRFVFQQLTEKQFPKNRSILNCKMELDGYCEELKLAFEYQGKQHYTFIKHLHRRKEIYEAQRERDKLKKILCDQMGITLIEVPYYEDLESFIKKELKTLAICPKKIDWNKFKGRKSMLEELCIAADRLNAKCLSTVYVNARFKMNFVCKKCGRKWQSTSNDIKNGYGCLQCSGKLKITIDKLQKRANNLNLQLLSKLYKNAKTKMQFKCLACSNVFIKTGDDIQQKKGCPSCSLQKSRAQITIP